jgi:hypothetical protein
MAEKETKRHAANIAEYLVHRPIAKKMPTMISMDGNKPAIIG